MCKRDNVLNICLSAICYSSASGPILYCSMFLMQRLFIKDLLID